MIECLFLIILFSVFLIAGKWIICDIAIVAGDKKTLHDFGNLCEDETMYYNGKEYDKWQQERWFKKGR